VLPVSEPGRGVVAEQPGRGGHAFSVARATKGLPRGTVKGTTLTQVS
jgi:hypothetical protein